MDFSALESFLRRVPSVRVHGTGTHETGLWWAKFAIDIDHPLAWRVVQELGHILNYVSLNDRLPTVFMPVSPPVYLNGGPREFLSWVIEARSRDREGEPTTMVDPRVPLPRSVTSGMHGRRQVSRNRWSLTR